MRKENKRKPLIRVLEPRILFDGAAVTTAIEVLDNNSFNNPDNSTTDSNDSTAHEPATSSESVPVESGDVFIITTDIPNYEVTAQNFAANFKVLILDQNSDNLKSQILDATKDLDKDLNIHIIAANQNRDKLLVGSYDSVDDLVSGLTSDSKLYDLNDLTEQNFTSNSSNQVVIIDEAVSYSQDLLDSIPADWKIITINSNTDGLTQILEKLEGISDLSAIHIFSHANSGEIILGNLTLDANTLNARANDLKALGTHLNSTGDILLYGCDVSSGFIGLDFVNEFALLTSADIAASDDKTGSYISNADFNLETTTGNIETQTITYDTNGTVLGYVNNYVFDINKNGSRLNYQASGQPYSGWWNGTENNWVDYYTNEREVSYFGIKWITVNAFFFSFSFPIPWINYYSYGTGVRYGVQEFTVDHDSKFQITANANNSTQNQLGGDRTQDVLNENYALYRIDENTGIGFDKYNPLRNLVTASEGLLAGGIYLGELAAGRYQVVASFDTWRWFPDIISLMTLNQYAEQFFEPVNLRVENLNRAPVWGYIADQTINGDGDKSIVATTWSNVSDADGDEITASAFLLVGSTETALPYWLTFNPNSLTFSGNPPANTGTLDIRIKAYDEQEYGYKDFKLTFTNDNDRPVIANEIKDTTWDGQGNFTYQIPTDTFTDADPDTDNFTYTAKLSDGSSLPTWLSISSSGLISGNPPADYSTLTLVVTVNDGSGQTNATQTDTFILNLKNNNDIATVNNRTITIDEDTTHIFSLADFVYTDLDTHSHADTLSGEGKTIKSIRIVELPQNGILWLDSDSDGVLDTGETVQTNQIILASSISKLKYTPNANWAGHGVLTPLDALLTGPDSFKWVSSDGYDESSNIATTTLNVKLVNDSPILSFSAGKTLNIRPNGGTPLSTVYVDEGLNLIDPDALYSNDTLFDTIFGISVTIIDSTTNKFVTGDTLNLIGDTTGFSVSYDSVNGILTIESTAGGARAAEYQALLRTLQFSSTDTTNNNLRTLGLSFRTQDVGSKTSAYFDGVDDYIETMNASIPTSGDFTISTWAKLDTPANLAVGSYTIFGQGISGSNIFLMINKYSDNTYTLRVGDYWTITNISSLLSDGKWHQYTITRSGSGATDGSLYIDGKFIEKGDISTNITAGYGLRIGRLYDVEINSGNDYLGYWKGSISDFRVYNKVLSSIDIQKSLSNNLVGNESGLNAWYKLVSDYKNYASISDGGNAVVFTQADYGYSIKTGHYYKIDTTGRDYSNASSNAQNSTYAGENGYLLRLDDSLSASEIEVVKMMESLKASTSYWYWVGAERYNSNGDWYWTAGPDTDVYFNHGSNEGLDNDPAQWNTIYGPSGWSGVFGGSWWSMPWVTTNSLQTQITFSAYAWDSWDWETLRVNLNGNTLFDINTVNNGAWNGNNSYSSSTNINGYNISYTITPTGYGGIGRSGYWDKSFYITLDIPANFASSIQLSFGAYTDQDLWDESAEIRDIVVKTYNPDYQKDKAYMLSTGYIDNYLSSNQSYSVIEYGNKGEVLSAPSLFATTNTALPDKYVNETRSITVRQTNNAPTLVPTGTATLSEDGEIKFQASNFISNFSDVDGDTLSKVVITSIPDSSKAQLLLNGVVLLDNAEIPTGDLDKLVLKPLADFNGTFTFKYKGSDGYLFSNESTVSVTVTAINDAPIITSNQTLTAINEDISNMDNTGQTIASIISDGTITDMDGTAVEAVAITSINNSYGTWQYKLANGSWANISNITGAKINLSTNALLLDSDSLVRFIPNTNFNGTSTFEFRAWDKSSGTIGGTTNPFALGGNNSISSDVEIATITINSVNDTPESESKTINIDEDISYIFTTKDFKFTDIDTADVLTSIKIATLPTLGTIKLNNVTINANTEVSKADIDAGLLTYISALDGFGTSYSSFTFSVKDGTTFSTTSTITFDVNNTNDAPTDISWASGGNVAENSEDGVIVGQLSAIDPNTGDELRFVRIENSKFIISTTGVVSVAKDAYLDFERNTTQTIKVKVTDSQGLSYIKDLTINITDVVENTPSLYTNILYSTKNAVTTITESTLRTEDADTSDVNLVYKITQAIEGGILFIDSNNNGIYNEGTDTILGPQSDDAPEYVENFTHQDVVDGKIKFFKDNTQINAKISLEVSDGNSIDDGLVVVVVSNPPILSAAIDDQEWGLTGIQNFTLPASTFTDADFDILTYSAKLSNNDPLPSWLSFNSTTGKFSGTPTGLNDGDTLSITVTATDGRTTPASDTFIITFKATITKPVIQNPLPEYIEFAGSGIKSYVMPVDTFSNPVSNTTLTYSATLGDGSSLPSWLSFDATTRTFSGNPPASAVSEPLILKITADNTTATTSTTIKLYISDPNDIPVNSGTVSDKTISDANTHTYTIDKSTFSDGDGDTITLILATQDGSEVPSWIQVTTDETTGNLTLKVKAPAGSGFQNLRVIGSDGNGGEAVSDFKITYSGGTNESPQVKTDAGISYMQNGILVTSPNGALEKFSILAGKTATITTAYLDENDPDDDGLGLIYTIVNEPLYGQLWIDSDGNGSINASETTLNAGDTFTQKDIDDRKLKYKHTAANITDDKFIFNLKDGGENSSIEVKNVTFNIDVLVNPTDLSMVSVKRHIPTDTLTNNDELKFKVKFSGVVFGVDVSDFEAIGTGSTNATISSVENLGSNEYMITVSNITSNNGDIGIALKSTTNIITTGGSAIDETFIPTINETFTLDNIQPTVTITPDRTIYAGTTAFKATLTFSEEIGGLSLDDITATNATLSNLIKIDDTHVSVDVTSSSGIGDITLDFASGKVTDTAGNSNTVASQVTITRNAPTTISNINSTATFTEIDGVDDNTNDVLFSLTGTSLADTDSTQDLQSLSISIPTSSILDANKEELIVNGTVIPLNFTDGKAILNITINSVEYKISALVDGTNSTLVFEKASGKMTLAQAEALLDVIKYNNSSDTLTATTNKVFSLIVNDGLENSTTSTVTISVVDTNDTPIISIETGNSATKALTDTTLNTSGTLSVVDLDTTQTVSVSKVGIATSGIISGLVPDNTALLAMLSINSGNVINNSETKGTINWAFNSGSEHFDYLANTEVLTLTYTIKVTDSDSQDSSLQTIVITITGTDGSIYTPVITSEVSQARGSVTESGHSVIGTATTTGTLTSNAVNSNWSVNTTVGTYGNITIDNLSGIWTYTLDDTKTATKALQTGDRRTETFTVTITDTSNSFTEEETIIIEINGTNDTPLLTTPSVITYTDTNVNDTFITQTGTLSSSDDDTGDTKVFNITGQSVNTSETGFTHSKDGTYGTLYLNALSGSYKYIPNDAKIEALTSSTSETFDFIVTDTLGASSTETLTISLTAVNDTPTITITSNDSDSESFYETNTTLTTQGTLSVTDLDLTNIVSSTVVQSMTIDGVASTDSTVLSWLSLNTASILSASETTNTLTWTFNSGSEYFNYLSQGETKTLVYTIRINDGTVDADKTVTINILGTNDAPTITTETGDSSSASLSETNTSLTTSDTITVNEIEPSNTITAIVENVTVNTNSTVSSLALPTNTILKAMLSLDKSTLLSNTTNLNELLTWTFNSGTEYFDKIALGETLILDYVIKISDNANPSKIDTQIVQITINGTNDAPIIDTYASNDTNINGLIESGKPLKLADIGTITFSDIDFSNRPTAGETLKSITALRRDGSAFILTTTQQTNITNAFNVSANTNNAQNGDINWEYAISQANLDFLGAGEQIEAVFTITITDNAGSTDTQDITIKLVGENKTPTLTEGIKNINESNTSIVETISVTAEDKNMSDSLTVTVLSGTYKLNSEIPLTMTSEQLNWLSLNVTTYPNNIVVNNTEISNTFNWDFNTNGKTFNELNTAETVKLVYTVQIIDDAPIQYSSTKTVTITITGTNDAPIAVIDVANTNENSLITIDVLANDTDSDTLDNSSNFTLDSVLISTNNHSTGYDASKVTTNSTVTIVDNKLVFTPNDEFDYLAQNDTAEVVITYVMSDDEGTTSTNTTTITITGTNDAPIISVEANDKASEDFIENINSITTSGTLSLNDKDTLNTVSANVDSVIISGDSSVGSLTNAYFKSMLTLTDSNILDNTNNDGIITWEFDSGSDVFDYIAKDEELILTYTIKALDSSGGIDTQNVVIKIIGTNNAPILDSISAITYTDTNLNDSFTTYNGSLVANDADLTDIKIYSITNQIIDISETGFTHSKLGNYGKLHLNENTGAFKYIPNEAKIEELTTTQTDEFIFNVTDNSGDVYNIDTKAFTVNLIGVNDTPTVLSDNIDTITSFGEDFKKETAYLFNDLDLTNIFRFEASNLPLGLSINPLTGEIIGRAVESGIFVITLKVIDSGTPQLNISKTFNLLVVAPPQQNDSSQDTQINKNNEIAQQIVKEITVDRITDMINSSSTILSDSTDNKNSIELLLDSQNNNSMGKVASTDRLDITRTELTSIVQSSSNNPNDKIITANANLNLDNTGKVNFNNKANSAFETVGLSIEKINFVQEQLEIKILDTRVGQKYIVTLLDGSDLPDTLSFDPNTGKITGVLPKGMETLNISIKALSGDGTTRVLNLKIDLKDLKQNEFTTLNRQVEKEHFKMSSYGDFITSLFDKSVAV